MRNVAVWIPQLNQPRLCPQLKLSPDSSITCILVNLYDRHNLNNLINQPGKRSVATDRLPGFGENHLSLRRNRERLNWHLHSGRTPSPAVFAFLLLDHKRFPFRPVNTKPITMPINTILIFYRR